MHPSTYHFRIAISRGVIGQKLICTRSYTDHLFGAQAQPNSLPKYIFTSFMQLVHVATHELQVWNHLLAICLDTPPRPTWGHSMHICDQGPRPPTAINSPNKGVNCLRLRIPKIEIKFVGAAQKVSTGPPQISRTARYLVSGKKNTWEYE
jgi:hypothetical protein